MNDVFISYASADRQVAQHLADALQALGWSVWWDREIPLGKAFDQVIEEELNAAGCAIVLWTRESVRSRWVKTEAAAAADRERLLPVLIEDVPVPLEFRRIQTAMLQGWDGDRNHPEFVRLVESVRRMLGQGGAPRAPEAQVRTAPAPVRRRVPTRIALGAAVVCVALLALLIGRAHWNAGDSSSTSAPPPGSASSQGSASAPPPSSAPADASRQAQTPPAEAAPASATAGAATPAKNAFAIRIGDRISDGVPGPGAGNIESPGLRDTYTFKAAAGQRVYFRMLEHGQGMSLIDWKLTDPDGEPLFESHLGHTEPGVVEPEKRARTR